jgi:hypothetical protein
MGQGLNGTIIATSSSVCKGKRHLRDHFRKCCYSPEFFANLGNSITQFPGQRDWKAYHRPQVVQARAGGLLSRALRPGPMGYAIGRSLD